MIDEGLEHGADFVAFTQNPADGGGIETVDFTRDFELGRDLGKRALGDKEELG